MDWPPDVRSPLLGVSTVGAWKYFHAKTPQQRARLPWFARPWFWITGFVLVTACFLKDTLGIAEDYFVTVPPDPPDAEAERLLRQLIELTDAVKD